jgi:hypothetical protein
MPVSAHDVAAELRARQPGMPVKKLHKLLYYCQGHHLAVHGEPLFRERFDEWVARESLPAELRRVVEAWVITRYANPYEGMFRSRVSPTCGPVRSRDPRMGAATRWPART